MTGDSLGVNQALGIVGILEGPTPLSHGAKVGPTSVG